MQEYLNKNIKELIAEYPAAGAVLGRYEIDCTTCQVGTCQLKDVISIHNLSETTEQALFRELAAVIYGKEKDKNELAKQPVNETVPRHDKKKFNYSPPLKKLVKEHVLIKRWLALIPDLCSGLEPDKQGDTHQKVVLAIIEKGLFFIRNYADKFHHTKEEDILFKQFDAKLAIIQAMCQEHTQARGYVKTMADALAAHDYRQLAGALKQYQALLQEHIKKEDEILYPWMDRQLSTRQVGDLYQQFNTIDAQASAMAEKEAAFVAELEAMFTKEPAQV